ncbi:MAG TPA: acyltransferase family protein, partial [Polyangiales bacterium]
GRPGIASQSEHVFETAVALSLGLLVIPMLGHNATLEHTVFPLNTPCWSLFFELVANAAFAIWARFRYGLTVVFVLMGVSWVLVLAGIGAEGTVNLGHVPSTFWLGFPRVGWSFGVGMLMYRYRQHAPRTHFAVAPVLLAVFLMLPVPPRYAAWYEAIGVTLVMPGLVFLALRCEVHGRLRALSTWSGNLSYPMYALHYPVVRACAVLVRRGQPSIGTRIAIVALVSLFILALSAVVFAKVDVPLRAWLARVRARRSAQAHPSNVRSVSTT